MLLLPVSMLLMPAMSTMPVSRADATPVECCSFACACFIAMVRIAFLTRSLNLNSDIDSFTGSGADGNGIQGSGGNDGNGSNGTGGNGRNGTGGNGINVLLVSFAGSGADGNGINVSFVSFAGAFGADATTGASAVGARGCDNLLRSMP